ncbi:MAG: ABC transporter substrate-binding protein [Chloroflexi bacterium]|nr:ABC transporter substrate-binding protein [Chloroflexota bacterium]
MKNILSIAFGIVIALAASACATPVAPLPAPTAAATSAAPVEVSLVMGYIPHVQFAPWYVAEKKGYFQNAGIKVKYNYGFELDGVKLVGANQADFALLGGDQVLQARAQSIPLVYVANWYNAFPIAIFSLKEKNITKPQDLVGKRVGLPGFFGATYTGWRALLYEAGIKEADVKTQDVGFNQVAALTQGTIDAAAGYSNNEPVQLKLAGKDLNVIEVSNFSRLVGIGLVTNEKTANEKSQLVQRLTAAFLRGVQDTIANPDEALNITVQAVPEAGGANLSTSKAVLAASIALWKSPRLGYVDPADWAASAKFMKDAGFTKGDFDLNKAYSNKFVP